VKYRILKFDAVPPSTQLNPQRQPRHASVELLDFQTDHGAAQSIASEWCGQASGRMAIVVADRDVYASDVVVQHEPGAGSQ
jgi:hypothetical protein